MVETIEMDLPIKAMVPKVQMVEKITVTMGRATPRQCLKERYKKPIIISTTKGNKRLNLASSIGTKSGNNRVS